jgi:hypothetical protein
MAGADDAGEEDAEVDRREEREMRDRGSAQEGWETALQGRQRLWCAREKSRRGRGRRRQVDAAALGRGGAHGHRESGGARVGSGRRGTRCSPVS